MFWKKKANRNIEIEPISLIQTPRRRSQVFVLEVHFQLIFFKVPKSFFSYCATVLIETFIMLN